MGNLWGKFRKKATTYEQLEKLDSQIKAIEEYGVTTELKQRKVAGRFMLVSVFLYLVTALIFYFYLFPEDIYQRILYIVPLIASPLIIIFIKRVLTWWYNRKLKKNQEKLSLLRKKKKEILDNVMEKETYKVAKQILETFAPDEVISRKSLNGNFETPKRDSSFILSKPYPVGLRQRALMQNAERATNMSVGKSAISDKTKFSENPMVLKSAVPKSMNNRTLQSDNLNFSTNLLSSTPKLPMVRSLLPRERSAFDKLVDFLVGDGPSNRYALICQKCFSHNGMALREEFEYLSFNCCYCHHFNHARKQKPPAPKLGIRNSPMRTLKEADTSDSEKNSSGSDSDLQTLQKNEEDQPKASPSSDIDADVPDHVNETISSTIEEMDVSEIPESS
ncbi:endoplasmic reticulum junction formation protein lunapark [Coccinella septempunctata]|uniref:endoplasmic reticulum junction formation protein lunapark n=1 Tax=Coccinella septempunctata TaxID=41139 RepID=UPI001D074036|nr:endoplasmic reticulum junction formation protein lunapark [Coccinella septempunctata]XP_044744586.1 endoplasmic reticulum junction formation protein lunapark [Coccinella septempunctata]XP_044744587.1 endoplasmic reticulum junction formation protein lunapark [Coccinella septempunctata]